MPDGWGEWDGARSVAFAVDAEDVVSAHVPDVVEVCVDGFGHTDAGEQEQRGQRVSPGGVAGCSGKDGPGLVAV